jgi:hypothetical protein
LKKMFLAYFTLGVTTGFTIAVGLSFHSLIDNGAALHPWVLPLCMLCAAGAFIVSRMSKSFPAGG